MNPLDQLKSVLCDPAGKCCIQGSEEDRAIVDRALQALAAPTVQEPDWLDKEKPETDWDHVWLLIKAASYASARGHMSGTTNWGAAMSAYLRHSTPPTAPAQEPDVLYKTAAQYPKRPYQLDGFDWLSPKTRTITVKSGVHVEITWDIEKKNCDVVLSPAQPATEDSSEVAAPAQPVQTAQEPVVWTAPEQCDSPPICRIRRACAGQFETQKKCTTPPAAQKAIEFGMHGEKMMFKVGVQQFTLDYKPDTQDEFNFMRDMVIHAFSAFTPNVKTTPPAQPAPESLEDQRKLPENAARLIIEAWIKGNYGDGYTYHLSDQDEGTSWAWWIDSHPFEDPDAATGFDGGTSWIDFEGRISDCSSIPDEFNTRMQATPPAAPVQEPVAWPMEEQPDGSIIPVDPSELPSDHFTTPPAARPAVQREHITDGRPCWCNPDIDYVDPETGAAVIVHKEPQ